MDVANYLGEPEMIMCFSIWKREAKGVVTRGKLCEKIHPVTAGISMEAPTRQEGNVGSLSQKESFTWKEIQSH